MFRQKLIDCYLAQGFEKEEAISEIDFVFELVANVTFKDLLMGKSVDEIFEDKILNIIKERTSTKKPIQQILGQAYFMCDKFFVDEYTLIPRPETEILVVECLKLVPKNDEVRILDIGTGSGCIPVSIAKRASNSVLTSVDICKNALKIARRNAETHNVENKITFKKSDVFSNIDEKFNIIVSNPPYIPITEKLNLQDEVRDFEPENALFAYDEAGIEFYKRIIEESKDYLLLGGYLLFELGINQSTLVKEVMLENNFSNINIIKDLDNIDRVITGQRI